MLKTTKSVTINGSSTTEDGVIIAAMHCIIPENNSMSYSHNITNNTLYEEHIEEVRADIDSFRAYCIAVEDEIRTTTTEE